VRIRRGSILIYRVFDIGEEINLPRVVDLLKAEQSPFRLRVAQGKGTNAVIIKNAPIRLTLGEATLTLGEAPVKCEVIGTIWDYGAFSVSFQVPLAEGADWESLKRAAAALTNDQKLAADIDDLARERLGQIQKLIRPAIQRPNLWEVSEDYVIYFLEAIEGVYSGAELLEKADLAALLLGELGGEFGGSLAPRTREAILQNVHQYASNDLVLIDWNSAVVLEPTGSRDIPDVLEFALSHLLEVRYYDDLLDNRLGELYDAVERGRQRLFGNPFAGVAKDSNTRYLEFSEFVERVDNSLKVVGDFYLATIFRLAMKRFRILDWQQSITRKMNMLARVSELLQGEVNVLRGHLLEIVIIVLILFEILSAMWKSG
jgi:hypothetical protein